MLKGEKAQETKLRGKLRAGGERHFERAGENKRSRETGERLQKLIQLERSVAGTRSEI